LVNKDTHKIELIEDNFDSYKINSIFESLLLEDCVNGVCKKTVGYIKNIW